MNIFQLSTLMSKLLKMDRGDWCHISFVMLSIVRNALER